ncbi:MAG: prefoldin subunit beta [Methanobacteriaceae archaeon]|nr:prefoldin subunit beta [Methanobacteriaceae archaeon]
MELPQNVQHQLNQFQQLQQQAQAVAVQKQSVDIQLNETTTALEELKKTEPGVEVFKTAGNLLIKVERDATLEELEDKVETLKLRQQTMSRQEERVMKKLEEMQVSIQQTMAGLQG